MEIKGTAVKATPDYVKQFYPSRYNEWIASLPEVSRKIMEQPIYATSWYNLFDSVIIPTRKVGDTFYNGNHEKAARLLGRYSSEIALQGIYKIFVRVSSPHFVLSRASSIFAAYYKPSVIKILESMDKHCLMEFSQFDVNDKLIMTRIGGWVEKTLEITLKTALRVDLQYTVNGSSLTTLMSVDWD